MSSQEREESELAEFDVAVNFLRPDAPTVSSRCIIKWLTGWQCG